LAVIWALALGFTLFPAFFPAAEFSYSAQPVFTLTYPDGGSDEEKTDPSQVWSIKYPGEIFLQAAVFPIPEGVDLKDVAEKVYKPPLEQSQKAKATMSENKEITLSDGTKAYYSEISWTHPPTGTPIVP
jgi:hypothetical protein